jgi:hypothetical protein
MAIMKKYERLFDFLCENKKKTVADLLDEIEIMCSGKTKGGGAGSTYLSDVKGDVVAVHDAYFQRWMPTVGLEAVEYGIKTNSLTGLNPMCKEGLAHWSKQQRTAKKAYFKLMKDLASGKVMQSEYDNYEHEIEFQRKLNETTDKGFRSKKEILEYLEANDITMGEV